MDYEGHTAELLKVQDWVKATGEHVVGRSGDILGASMHPEMRRGGRRAHADGDSQKVEMSPLRMSPEGGRQPRG
jgi:hypothetical protein